VPINESPERQRPDAPQSSAEPQLGEVPVERRPEARDRLQNADQRSEQNREQWYQRAADKFSEVYEKVEDFTYENRKVILAAAAAITLFGMFKGKKKLRNWGLLGLAVSGAMVYRHGRQQPNPETPQQPTPAPTPAPTPSPTPTPSEPERRRHGFLDLVDRATENRETADTVVTRAMTRLAEIQRQGSEPTDEDRALFRQAIEALLRLKDGADEATRNECQRKIDRLRPYATNPSDEREVVSMLSGFGRGYFDYLGAMIPVSLAVGALRSLRNARVGQRLVQLARAGDLTTADRYLQNMLTLNNWELKTQCERLLQLAADGTTESNEYRQLSRSLSRQGVDASKARRICRSFSTNHPILRFLAGIGEADIANRARLYEEILSPALRTVLTENRAALERIFGSFGNSAAGGRRLSNFLRRLSQFENAEQILRNLSASENASRIQSLITRHSPDVLEGLLRHAGNSEKLGHLLTVLERVPQRIDLPGRSWDRMLAGFLRTIEAADDPARAARELAERATEQLAKHSRFLHAAMAIGMTLEVILAVWHLIEAQNIDRVIQNLERYGSSERVAVLQDKLRFKLISAGVSAAAGIYLIFANPSFTVIGAAMAIQYFVESGFDSYYLARERRARSAQSWAAERRRENLVRVWVGEHGLSDGDRLNPWVSRENLQAGNLRTRTNLIYGILLQEYGITDAAQGQQIMNEVTGNAEYSTLQNTSRLIKDAYAWVVNTKPQLDPESPMEANRLITQGKLYAQLKAQREQLISQQRELQKLLRGPGESQLDGAFQVYLEGLLYQGESVNVRATGEARTQLVQRFMRERYAHVTDENVNRFRNLNAPNLLEVQRLIRANVISAATFFQERVTPADNRLYGGLATAMPLSGSVFDERSTETIPALTIRQNLEARINDMYTLLALESSSGGHRLAHHAEIDQCFNFCMRYYQSVMGVPYQPMSNTVQLEEGRVYRWIQSLALTRTNGHGFTTAPSAAEAQGYAMTDTEIEINFQVSRQPSTMMLYGLARALGYRGPLRIEDIRQHFSEAKKEDLGFYYNGEEWVVNDANGFDQEFEEWVDEKLEDASVPAAQRAFLQRVKSGELKAWEENPMVIDFLIDFCTRYKSEMFEREDERWWIPDDAEAAQAQERIGASYSTFLRAERDRIRGLEGPAARTAFQTQLNAFLGTHRGQYVVLPPAMIRTAYLAGFNNIGLFAYKLDGENIRAHQLAPLSNNERPSFINSIDNAASFDGFQFPDSLQRAIDALADERSAHADVLSRSKTALETQINSVDRLDTEKKESLRHATSGIIEDFGELDRIVFHETFEITDAHKRSFAQRMRIYILQVSQLVFRVRGNQSTEVMNEIYTIRRIVHKMKQLYLISFLNRSHVDEDSWIFHDHEVDHLSDYTRIEADMNAHMNQYTIGELYANNDGIRRFYTAEETRLENLIASVADGPNKNAYRQYYLRETSEIIYLANVYGFDSQGNLNSEPPTIKPVIDTAQEREAMQRLLISRRLSYQDWLRYYRGESAERAREQSQFNVQNHRRSVEPIVTREDQAFERAKLNATAATHAAKSMLAMCLTFRDLIGQIRQTTGQSATSRTDFGELNAVYNTFNGSRFMDGGLDSMGDVDLFSGRYREMDRAVDHPLFGTMFVNRSHEMVAFYRLHRTQMRQGVQMLWDYLAIDPELRSTFHRQLGDTRLDSFAIRRVTMLVQTLRQSGDILPAEQSNAYKLWYLANNPALDQAVTYIEHHPDRNHNFFNAGQYERAAFESMYAELFHADAPIRALVGSTVAGQETLNKYVEARTAIRNIIRTIREAARDRDQYVMHRQLMTAVNKVRDFQRQYRTLLGEVGINPDRWGWTSSRTLRLTRDLSLPAVNATNQRELLSGYTQPASEETFEGDHFGEALEETFEERVEDVSGAVRSTNDAVVNQLDEWSDGAYSERVNEVRSSVSGALSNAREEAKEIPLIGRLFE